MAEPAAPAGSPVVTPMAPPPSPAPAPQLPHTEALTPESAEAAAFVAVGAAVALLLVAMLMLFVLRGFVRRLERDAARGQSIVEVSGAPCSPGSAHA